MILEKFHPNMPQSTEFGLQHLLARGLSLSIGKYTYGIPQVSFAGDKGRRLVIGSYCSIAADVSIYIGIQGRHPLDFLSTYPMSMIYGKPEGAEISTSLSGNLDVEIGNDVWIGRGSLILAGVSIGDGAVIAARSVVTSNVPPYAIVGSVPAKIIRYRFDEDIVKRLLNLKWWDMPEALLRENRNIFFSSDIKEVIFELEKIKLIASDKLC